MTRETVEEFMERIHVNFRLDKVFIYPTPRMKKSFLNGPSEVWDVQTARNYIRILEQEDG